MPRRPPEPVPPKGLPKQEHRQPLWDRVDTNRLKLAGYVVLFVVSVIVVFDLLFLVFGGCLGAFVLLDMETGPIEAAGRIGIVRPFGYLSIALGVAALVWALFTLARSEKWLLVRFGAELVPKGELLDTKLALKDMAIAAGLPISPALHIIENSTVNAFVFSAHRRRAVLGVTRGLVNKLTVDEQRAVFANLVARLARGDTIVDTGIASLMWPLNAWRNRNLEGQNDAMDDAAAHSPDGSGLGPALFFFGFALAIVGEFFAWGQRRRQLRAAEKGDAEGMLLLKDPGAMLAALEKCVHFDNVVPGSGDTFADLFYCWTGDSSNDDNDPEWERVARLREVLGVEGVVRDADSPLDQGTPLPPRLGDAPYRD